MVGLKHLLLENKKCRWYVERIRNHLKSAPTSQIWDNLSIT